ncbi:unnamed protein product [Soboliphyme baturini]|uniref:Uncharacterized protein n=1 Tax=Soboliphyme baturini TaxID=241478 RepID=A0A183J9K1_9BILA|nr:unnamed protein product [Soboliphyme baturini]
MGPGPGPGSGSGSGSGLKDRCSLPSDRLRSAMESRPSSALDKRDAAAVTAIAAAISEPAEVKVLAARPDAATVVTFTCHRRLHRRHTFSRPMDTAMTAAAAATATETGRGTDAAADLLEDPASVASSSTEGKHTACCVVFPPDVLSAFTRSSYTRLPSYLRLSVAS